MPGRLSTYFQKNTISAVCVSFSAVWSLAAILLIFLFPSPFEGLNSKLYDWKMSIKPVSSYSPEIVHVDVDDKAIKEFGQWPWDRALGARIVKNLSEFGARVVMFDILYASAGKSNEGNESFFDAIKRAGNVVSATGLGGLTDQGEKALELPQDRSLADALYDKAWALRVPRVLNLLKVSKLQSSALPLLPIIQLSSGVGYITATPDRDGVYRRVPLLVRLEDRCVPSLSFSALMAYWRLTPEQIVLNAKREIEIRRGHDVVRIPVDRHGMLLINWGRMWTGFKRYSVTDVLSENPDTSRSNRYKDKIVIVAVTATGNTDFGTTPLSVNAPLSRIHSHTLNTILTGNLISPVPAFPWMVMLAFIFAMGFPLASARLSLKVQAALVGFLCLGAIFDAIVCFSLWSYDVALSEHFFIFLPAACGSLVIRGASVERQVAQARRALERYLPPELLETTLSRGISPDVSTRRQEMTIVFVDMEGFAALSETVEVEYVSRFLKEFFDAMTRAILKHQGRIHQFLGDGFLAVFGDLIPLEQHAYAAFAAALDMQKEMTALNSGWANSGIREFQKGIRIRIGMNTGMVFAGDLGADHRLEYTIVGSTVNIASRLQSLAPPGGIMMTSRTRALLKNAGIIRGPENVRLKGLAREMEVYTIDREAIEAT